MNVYLADAFLSGSLSVANPPAEMVEVISYGGGNYFAYGFMPAILLLPFVAFWGGVRARARGHGGWRRERRTHVPRVAAAEFPSRRCSLDDGTIRVRDGSFPRFQLGHTLVLHGGDRSPVPAVGDPGDSGQRARVVGGTLAWRGRAEPERCARGGAVLRDHAEFAGLVP